MRGSNRLGQRERKPKVELTPREDITESRRPKAICAGFSVVCIGKDVSVIVITPDKVREIDDEKTTDPTPISDAPPLSSSAKR